MTAGNLHLDAERQEQRAIRYWYRPAGGSFSFVSWAAVLDRSRVWSRDDNQRWRLEYSFEIALVPAEDPVRWPTRVTDLVVAGSIIDDVPPRPPAARTGDPAATRPRSYRELVKYIGAEPAEGPVANTQQIRTAYARSRQARAAVLVRSAGRCENDGCTGMAPDVTTRGEAIMEVDHIDDLALGGPDHPSRMIALCPNCHAAKTRGRNRGIMRRHLRTLASRLHQSALEEQDGSAS